VRGTLFHNNQQITKNNYKLDIVFNFHLTLAKESMLETKLIIYTSDRLANVMNRQIGLDYDLTDLIAKTRACWSKQAEWWT
jgi:hypothetical protein